MYRDANRRWAGFAPKARAAPRGVPGELCSHPENYGKKAVYGGGEDPPGARSVFAKALADPGQARRRVRAMSSLMSSSAAPHAPIGAHRWERHRMKLCSRPENNGADPDFGSIIRAEGGQPHLHKQEAAR